MPFFMLPNLSQEGGRDVKLYGQRVDANVRVAVLVATKRPGGLDAILERWACV
jgi:hypothetical protein